MAHLDSERVRIIDWWRHDALEHSVAPNGTWAPAEAFKVAGYWWEKLRIVTKRPEAKPLNCDRSSTAEGRGSRGNIMVLNNQCLNTREELIVAEPSELVAQHKDLCMPKLERCNPVTDPANLSRLAICCRVCWAYQRRAVLGNPVCLVESPDVEALDADCE